MAALPVRCCRRLVKVKTDAGAVILTYTYGSSNERLMTEEGALRTYYARSPPTVLVTVAPFAVGAVWFPLCQVGPALMKRPEVMLRQAIMFLRSVRITCVHPPAVRSLDERARRMVRNARNSEGR